MQENKKDKIKINALLETYSIKDISTIFSGIDNKLMSLHQCSSEDFLNLNNDFKELYNQSKLISDNVDSIFELINTNENKELYKEIHEFYGQLKLQIELFDNKVAVTMKFLEELSGQLRFIFFPLKNYAQNIMSLKYLIANLGLTISYGEQSNHISKKLIAIEKKIQDLKQLAEKISKNLNHLRKVAKISFSSFVQVKSQNEINIEELLSIVKNRVDIIDNRLTENKDCIPKIRKKTEKSSESISDIIKKLQYQDIIRQKMEHIQKTHKDIISELKLFEDVAPGDKHLNEKAKFFLRVRDIAGLQAAQLIQANKEYQSALEIIINNFMQIGDNMKDIANMCSKVSDVDDNSEVELFKEVQEQIETTEEGLSNKFDQNKKLYKDIVLINNQLVQSESYVMMFNKLNDELNTEMIDLFKELESGYEQENVKEPIEQLQQLYSEIKTNGLKIENVTEKITPIKNRIKGFINEHKNVNLSTDFDKVRKVATRLNSIRVDVNTLLQSNYEISNKVLNNIKLSISNIKYYDFFESIIEEIIKELNNINFNLKVDDESTGSKDDNLEQLKEYYTMESEHLIHDKITEGEDSDVDIDLDEDGDIEFF